MVEKSFPGTLDSLEPIRDYVAQMAESAGLHTTAVYKLCLAVDEIATNIVTHGYDEAGLSGDILVRADVVGDKLQISLKDRGRAYDPDTHEQPADTGLDLPLEDRRIGGLGIFLARTSVDQLEYATGEDGNVHRFIVELGRNQK
jgi:serine/threonine-protein kinase RsbW